MNNTWEEIPAEQYQDADPAPSRVVAVLTEQVELSKVAAKLAGMLLLLTATTNLLALGLDTFSQGLHQAYGLSNGMLNFLTSLFPCLLADLFALWFGCVLLQPQWKRSFCRSVAGTGSLRGIGIFASLAGSLCAVFVAGFMMLLLQMMGFSLLMPEIAMPQDDRLAAALYLGYVCLIGPILEELLFRGVALPALLPFGKGFAIFASALLFGLFHGNPLQVFTGFFVGILLGFLTVECKSIYPAMLAHIFNNSFVSIMELFPSDNPIYEVLFMGVYMVLAIIFGLLFLATQHKRLYNFTHTPSGCALSLGARWKRLLGHPLMILYLLCFVALCVTFFLLYVAR